MKRNIKSLFFDKRGLALVEFALVLPLLLVLFFGIVELSRYILITQKLERSVYSMSNMTGQFVPITSADGSLEIDVDAIDNQIFPQFKKNMEPYIADADRVAIVTSMSRVNNTGNNTSLKINWQRAGGGTLSDSKTVSILNGLKASAINSASENGVSAGTSPSFPSLANPELMDGALKDMAVGENMIIVESFYKYRPIASNFLSGLGQATLAEQTLSSVVYSRPRFGDLETLVRTPPPVTPPPVTPPPKVDKKCTEVDKDSVKCVTTGTAATGTKTTCYTCTQERTCTTCTTPFHGATTCVTAAPYGYNCTSKITYTPPTGTYPPPSPG